VTITYLCRAEVADRIGVTPGSLSRYKLPVPDAQVGKVRGWLPATIDRWHASRPGRGARTDLQTRTNVRRRGSAEMATSS
jgi:hypothetical protein